MYRGKVKAENLLAVPKDKAKDSADLVIAKTKGSANPAMRRTTSKLDQPCQANYCKDANHSNTPFTHVTTGCQTGRTTGWTTG